MVLLEPSHMHIVQQLLMADPKLTSVGLSSQNIMYQHVSAFLNP